MGAAVINWVAKSLIGGELFREGRTRTRGMDEWRWTNLAIFM
jgi:hypothetical protein